MNMLSQVSMALQLEEFESFFPFDPFKLRTCGVYVDSLYIEWDDIQQE
jgi:hypothetical protein